MNTKKRLRSLIYFVVFAATGISLNHSAAQDTVTVKDPRTGKFSQFEAQVLEWDAERLLYMGNGKQRSMPATRVVDVSYPRTESQLEADQLFSQGKLLQAMQTYQNAIADEPRPWVKSELQARQLQCALALNRQRDAITLFLAIQQASPNTRFFHLIPISWDRTRLDGALAANLSQWLTGSDEVRQLIAASWLQRQDETNANAALKSLSQSSDPRIAHLATAQLWRPEIIAPNPTAISRWEAALDRMPQNFQAGPRYLVAAAKRRANRAKDQQAFNEALVSMLQVPILFPADYQVAAAALLEAHNMLTTQNRQDEAAIVLAELTRDYPLSTAAMSLETRVENLDQ